MPNDIRGNGRALLPCILAMGMAFGLLGGATLAHANTPENRQQALAELAVLETAVIDCYRAKDQAITDGRSPSGIRCFDDGNATIFTTYRKTLRRLGLFRASDTDIRSGYSALIASAYACRARTPEGIPPLAEQELCATEAFDTFAAVIGGTPPPPPSDTTPPVITVNQPADGAVFAESSITVSGSITDSESSIAQATINGLPLTLEGQNFSVMYTLAEGSNRIEISATDAADNTASTSVTVTFRTEPPTEDPEEVTELAVLETQVLACIAEHGTSPTTATTASCLRPNGRSIYADYRRTLRRLDLFSRSVRNAYIDLRGAVLNCIALTNGNRPPVETQLSCTADAFDLFQNVVAPGSVGGNPDTTPPNLTISSPVDGLIFSTPEVIVSGEVSDTQSTIASVTVNGTTASVSNGAYSATILLGTQGSNALTVVATDARGNTATANRTIVLDSLPPEIEVLTPPSDSVTTATTTELQTQFTDSGTGITSYVVNGVQTTLPEPAGQVSDSTTVALDPGPNTITFSAFDAAGNSTTGSIVVTSDSTAPELEIQTPVEGAVVGTGRLAVSALASDAESGIDVVTINGTEATLEGDRYSGFVDLSAGANQISVAATNNAGLTQTNVVNVTFTASGDTTPPMVDSTYPQQSATDVNLNSLIIVRFSEPVNPDSVNAATFSLSIENSAIPGAATLSEDGLSAVFRSDAQLPSNTLFTVRITGITDVAGNELSQPLTYTFATGEADDSEQFEVIGSNIVRNSTDIGTNASIRVQFNTRVNPASITQDRWRVSDSQGQQIQGQIQVDAMGESAAFVPTNPLPVGRDISVNLSTNIESANREQLNYFYLGFEVGFDEDNEAPQVVAYSPANTDVLAPVNAKISLLFSEPIGTIDLQKLVQVSLNGVPVTGSIALSDANRRVTFTPTTLLIANTTYQASLAGVIEDASGNQLSSATVFSFTTSATEDETRLEVDFTNPLSSFQTREVPADVALRIHFEEPVDATTLSAIVLFQRDPFQAIPVSLTLSTDGKIVSLEPDEPLIVGKEYSFDIRSELRDLAGNSECCFSSSNRFQIIESSGTPELRASLADLTGVPRNARLSIDLNRLVDLASVNDQSVRILQNGNLVSGTFTFAQNGLGITFQPDSPLASNTTYTLEINGITDVAGNAFEAVTSAFTTGNSTDTSRPTLISTTPASGDTNVDRFTTITLVFDDQIEPSSVSVSALSVTVERGTTLQLAANAQVNGNTVTLRILEPLPTNSELSIRLPNVTNVTGQQTFFGGNLSFTTGGGIDLLPPQLLLISPEPETTSVSTSAIISLIFSESIEPDSITSETIGLFINGVDSRFSLRQSMDSSVVNLRAFSDWPENARIELIADGLRDLAGNEIDPIRTAFETGTRANTAIASVIETRPRRGAVDVSELGNVSLVFSAPMNLQSVANALRVAANGVLISGTVSSESSTSADESIVVFTPDQPLPTAALITVRLLESARTLQGILARTTDFSYRTVNTGVAERPRILNADPQFNQGSIPVNALIAVRFSEAMDASSLAPDAVALINSSTGESIPLTPSLSDSGRLLNINPNQTLEPNTVYQLRLRNRLADLQGERVSTSSETTTILFRNFRTGENEDSTIGTVSAVSPAVGAPSAPENTLLRLRLSKPISVTSLSASNFALLAASGAQTQLNFSVESDGFVIELTPERFLQAGQRYTLDTQGILDTAGNPFEDFSSSFTVIEEFDRHSPGFAISPSQGAVDVPTNSPVEMIFDEPVDQTSLFDAVISARTTDGVARNLPVQFSLAADQRTLTVTPEQAWPVGQRVRVSARVKDYAGNQITPTTNFTLAFSPDSEAPEIVSLTPADGSSNVPLNQSVSVRFSEAIADTSVQGITLTHDGEQWPIDISLSEGNTLMHISTTRLLSTNSVFFLDINGLTDLSGNPLARSFTGFVTARGIDIQHPRISTASVAAGTVGVPLTPTLRLRFTESVAPETVNSTNLTLREGNSSPLDVTVSLDPTGIEATLTPIQPLLPNTGYVLQVNQSVTDLTGNALDRFFSSSFTTQIDSASAPVLRVNSNIESGSLVPINATLRLSYNQPLDAVSLLFGNIALERGGSRESADVELVEGNTIEINPVAALAPGQTYTLRLQNLTSLNGSVVPTETLQFTTSSSGIADTQGPELVAQTPVDGAQDVPVNSVVSLVFDEAIDPTSVTDRSVELRTTSQPPLFESNDILADINITGNTVTLTPVSLLPGATEIEVRVDQLLDLAGNSATFIPRARFTTAAEFEDTPPELLLVQPAAGQSQIARDEDIALVFSESLASSSIDNDSIRFFVDGEPVSTWVTRMADNSAFTVRHSSFPAGASVQLLLSDKLEDLSGNSFSAVTLNWTVEPASQGQQTTVVLQRPASGSNQQDPSSEVVLLTSAPIDENSARDAFKVSENGFLKSGAVVIQNGNQGLRFIPDTPFSNDAIVEVFLNSTADDQAGNPVRSYLGNFRIASDPADTGLFLRDTNLNRSFAANPTNLVIDLRFNKPLDPLSVNSAGVVLLTRDSQQAVPSNVQLIDGGQVIRIQPSGALSASTEYVIELNALTDGLGNALTSAISFATGDSPDVEAPAAPIVSPSNEQEGVPLNVEIRIELDPDVNLVTALTDHVQLVDTVTGKAEPYTPSVVADPSSMPVGQRLTLIPTRALEPNSLYELRIQGLEDHALNPVPSITSQFTTGTPVDLIRPTLMAFAPTGEDVPVNSVVILHFNEPLAPASAWQAPITLRDSVTRRTLPGRVEQSADQRELRFIPTTAYAVGRTIQASWSVHDLAGNSSSGTRQFRVSFESDTSAPQLLGQAPTAETIAPPINSRVTLKFDEPISHASAAGLTLNSSGAEVIGLEVLEAGMGSLLSLRPTRLLTPNTTYSYSFQGLSDLAGNQAVPISGTFTVGAGADLAGIELVNTSLPLDSNVPLPLDLSITLQFSEPLLPATMVEGSFELWSSAAVVGGTLAGGGDTWVFTPDRLLQPNTSYSLRSSGSITDLAGNGLRLVARNTRFITGDAPSGNTAQISQASLQGQEGVAVNSPLTINLSEAIDRTSVNSSSVVVLGPDGPVDGQIELDRRSLQLVFTPATNFSASSNFTFQISGLRDLLGRAVPESSGTFSTRSSTDPDTTPPSIIQSTPSGSGVTPTTSIVLTYSETIAPTSVSSDTITVSTGGFQRTEFAIDFVLQGNTLNITPKDTLPDETEIRVSVNLSDLAGNRRSDFSAALFTTAAGSDTVPPTIISSSPRDGSTDAQATNGLTIMFSEPMNPALLTRDNIQLFRAGERASSFITISDDNRVIRLTSLSNDSSYQVLLSDALQDLSGNSFAPTRLSFSTAPSSTGTPQVIDQRPASGATQVAPNTPVSLFLSRPLNEDTLPGAFVVSENGVIVAGTHTLNNSGTVAQFTPNAPFSENALIDVFLTAEALGTNGTPSRRYVGMFRTATVDANTPTRVTRTSFLINGLSTLPVNAVLEVEFSQPISTASLGGAEIELLQSGTGVVDSALSLSADGRVLSVTPTNPLAPQSNFQLEIRGLEANDGAGVQPFFGTFQTQTEADNQAPQVLAVSPSDTIATVPLNTRLTVRLNETINPISVNAQSVRLLDSNNNSLPVSASFTSNNTIIELVPLSALNALTDYTLVIENLRDSAGNELTDTVVNGFQSSNNIETNRVSVIDRSPVRNQSDVPVNTTISYRFDQPLQAAKLSDMSVQLRNLDNFPEVVEGTVSTDLGHTLLIFTPTTNLRPATRYEARTLPGSIEGLAGNELRFTDSFDFTTSTDEDVEPPAVLATSPRAGATTIPLNLREIRLNIDEPVRSVTDLSVLLSSATSAVPVEATLDSSRRQLRIELADVLESQAQYTLELSGLTDFAGNVAPSLSLSFTTTDNIDLDEPTVSLALPADDAIDVSVNTSIEWNISEPLALPPGQGSPIRLTSIDDRTSVPLVTTFSANGQTLVFTPVEPLLPNTEYEVSENFSGTTLTDYAGNRLRTSRTRFTTAP